MVNNVKSINSPSKLDELHADGNLSRKGKRNKSLNDRIQDKIRKIALTLKAIDNNFEVDPRFRELSSYVIFEFRKRVITRGLPDAIKHMKETRLAVTRFTCGTPLTACETVVLNNSGYPKGMVKYAGCSLQSILTVLSVSRCFNLKASPDINSIVTPSVFPGNGVQSITEEELQGAARELKVTRQDSSGLEFHSTTKSGPNGQALLSALKDHTLLPTPLQESILRIAGVKLFSKMQAITNANKDLGLGEGFYNTGRIKDSSKIRKLAYFPDKEGKTRVIAILDYWTQTALRPMHDKLNAILKRIEQDCTFNQSRFLEVIPKGPYYSLDLTAATDRMPIAVQRRVISLVFGRIQSFAGMDLLVSEGFLIDNQTVKYAAGQPMGAYSSGCSMALTHHFLVKIAARRCKLYNFKSYALLGDDIVIANRAVAESYKRLLHDLNMPISMQKTHVSLDTYEFAKRWVHFGKEVTPFAINSILETWKSYPMFNNSIQTQLAHGGKFKESGRPDSFLEDIMGYFGKFSQAKRTSKLLNIYTLLQKFIKLENCDGDSEKLTSLLALPDKTLNDERVKSLIRCLLIKQGIQDKSNLLNNQKSYLGLMADKLKVLGLGAERTELLRTALIDNTPISGVFTSLYEKYDEVLLKLKDAPLEEVSEIYTSRVLSGSAFNLNVFTMRQSHSRVYCQSRIVKEFGNSAKEIFPTLDGDTVPISITDSEMKSMKKIEKMVSRLMIRRKSLKTE